jgi:hypothetical protein
MRRTGGDELREVRWALGSARARLEQDHAGPVSLTDVVADVERLVSTLAATAGRESVTDPVKRQLLDWRDRMSSYLLAADALQDSNVDRGVAVNLLARGLSMFDEELVTEEPTVGAAFT